MPISAVASNPTSKADIAMARRWYETAIKLGSTEAGQRLAMLASTNP